MWLNLNIGGVRFCFKIHGYSFPKEDCSWDDQWCSVSLTLQNDWMDFRDNSDILLSYEVDNLMETIGKLLNDEIDDITTMECIEPDFTFILHPKHRKDASKYFFIASGHEIEDIYLEFIISLCRDGSRESELVFNFYRNNLEILYSYLKLVTKRIPRDDKKVIEMIEEGIILGSV